MDPYVEQNLRDEVIYLHSLWRRGPPAPTTTLLPNPSPLFASAANPRIATGSRPGRKRRRNRMTQMKNRNEAKIQKVSESGWTCTVEASRSAAGTVWPAFQAKSDEAPELTVEDRATMSARRVQQRAVEASRLFFSSYRDSDSEDDLGSEEEESESESLVEADVRDGCEEFIFFKKLFEEDEELRGYYQKNWGDGEFCCLVCRGNGEKDTEDKGSQSLWASYL
uniref:Uncharacterized protein n=1 Tax=Kalanchoe fedtschenkoi TaxID=63787 RepID=A0A7N0TE20_KALFE